MVEQHGEILTGRFHTGTEEQKKVICRILGDNTPDAYELYFHWYNIMHELAHLIVSFNGAERLTDTAEEQYVNDFAVAYWALYGEDEKNDQLSSIVKYGLCQFISPSPDGENYLDFFQRNWGNGALYNFNDYGWFQFNCVNTSLHSHETLAHVIQRRFGIREKFVHERISYDMHDENTSQRIVDDARAILTGWGLTIPPVTIKFIDNPDDHRINIVSAAQ